MSVAPLSDWRLYSKKGGADINPSLISGTPTNNSVHRTGVLAAVEEVEGWSNHGAQQDVNVAASPLGYRVVNVVLEKAIRTLAHVNMHGPHHVQNTVPLQPRVASTYLQRICSRREAVSL